MSRPEFVEFHKKLGITVTAYAPFAAPTWTLRDKSGFASLNIFNEPLIKELAGKYQKKLG